MVRLGYLNAGVRMAARHGHQGVGIPDEKSGRLRQALSHCGAATSREREVASNRILAAVVGSIALGAAGVAVAANYASAKQTDFFAPGHHQFYVWCAAGDDYTATQKGISAEDAQMKLYNEVKAAGRPACWPVWQGRVSG